MKRHPFSKMLMMMAVMAVSSASLAVADSPSIAPDNAANNAQDRNSDSKTPLDQSEANADVQMTAQIRRAVVDDKSISVDGHNVKIITTKDHVVYLRGPVADDTECKKIEAIAKQKAGDYTVKNELKSQITGH